MPNYRVELMVQHDQEDAEDQLENQIAYALARIGLHPQEGPVVFRSYKPHEWITPCRSH